MKKMTDLEIRPVIRPYEAVYILNSDTPEEKLKILFRKNKEIIEKQFQGEVYSLDTWGKRVLGNPIKKQKRALYFHCTFKAAPECIREIERTMGINDNVLRFMHTRLEDDTDLGKYLQRFKEGLKESANREREREAKFQARRQARPPRRDDRRGDEGRPPRQAAPQEDSDFEN